HFQIYGVLWLKRPLLDIGFVKSNHDEKLLHTNMLFVIIPYVGSGRFVLLAGRNRLQRNKCSFSKGEFITGYRFSRTAMVVAVLFSVFRVERPQISLSDRKFSPTIANPVQRSQIGKPAEPSSRSSMKKASSAKTQGMLSLFSG